MKGKNEPNKIPINQNKCCVATEVCLLGRSSCKYDFCPVMIAHFALIVGEYTRRFAIFGHRISNNC